MEKEQEQKALYEKHGFMGGAMGQMIGLVLGVGIAVLLIIMIGVLAGQTYNIVEPKILNISDATIQTSIKNSVKSGFSALEQTGSYMPILVMAYIIALVIVLVLGFANIGGGSSGGGAL